MQISCGLEAPTPPWSSPETARPHRTDKLEPLGEALPMLEFAAAETRKRAPHLTHPLLCLEAIKVGVEQGGQAGLKQVGLQRGLSGMPGYGHTP